ncbi:MAG: type II toxin-antitoxin system VapC family toxin [Ectothiorhodospiraceae bacterium]|nr:type II toxin-antitoxin system VapC family toxin [Ectothiorhodospiraceae bacterium]
MILVDTSVWIDHLRTGNAGLTEQLKQNRVTMHPMVLGELACGNLQNRAQLLQLWQQLTSLPTATQKEALYFIDQHQIMGKGIGFIDVHLLASVALAAGTTLWTRDKRLARIAGEMQCAWEKPR